MDRFEAITYLQLSRGMLLAEVSFNQSLDITPYRPNERPKGVDGPTKLYLYKLDPHMGVAVADTVVVGTKFGTALGIVKRIMSDMPSDACPAKDLRWIVQKVDLTRVNELESEESRLADQMAKAEVAARLQEFARATGFNPMTLLTPALTPPPPLPESPRQRRQRQWETGLEQEGVPMQRETQNDAE